MIFINLVISMNLFRWLHDETYLPAVVPTARRQVSAASRFIGSRSVSWRRHKYETTNFATIIYFSLGFDMESSSVKLILFIIVTCGLYYVSRKSLRVMTSHGFYRFIAWESILALLLLNMSAWFSNPFSIQQIASWLFLIGSLVLLINGIHQLRSSGNSSDVRQDETLYTFEKTTTIVTSGIYHYIRHPLYASLLYLAIGVFLKDITWYSVCLIVVVTISIVTTAKKDEVECIRFFGPIYKDYILGTKMFVPFLF